MGLSKKQKLIAGVLAIALLGAAFFLGGNSPQAKGEETGGKAVIKQELISQPSVGTSEDQADNPPSEGGNTEEPGDFKEAGKSAEEQNTSAAEGPSNLTGSQPAQEDSALSGNEEAKTEYSCTISISCATILDNMDWLNPEKVDLVPADGWILKPVKAQFKEGESVFDVLARTCRERKIHMEYSDTPMYNSAYIEGIYNLYEFDCGELSGWMYSVNDWFPNYGASRYMLKDGDVICWVYTCDLGNDVGGGYSAN